MYSTTFLSAENEILRLLKGADVTPSYFDTHGFTQPIIVEENDGLRLKVPPPTFSISDVERMVGEWGSYRTYMYSTFHVMKP